MTNSVSLAFVDGDAIFLDLRADRYVGLNRALSSALLRLFTDAGGDEGDEARVASLGRTRAIARGAKRMEIGSMRATGIAVSELDRSQFNAQLRIDRSERFAHIDRGTAIALGTDRRCDRTVPGTKGSYTGASP
jgi:hypothetical protein